MVRGAVCRTSCRHVEQAFCRSTKEPVLNVTNREIPIASRVNDQ
eukprot:COSAG06_NODE_70128_length_193_cov_291.702128_1_plen_43_part_01